MTKANAAAPQSTTYTKAETNVLLAGKANLVDGKIPASEYDIVTYIAGSNISIDPANRVDLFEYTWSNVAPNSTTSWTTISDSKSLTSAVIGLESVTKFKLQAATKQTHTIFFSGAFVDSNNTLHDFPSSELNPNGTIKQDAEIDVPSGYTGMRLTVRLDNQMYQQGSEVHESDFDYIRIEIMEGTHSKAVGDQQNKIISVVPDLNTTYATIASVSDVLSHISFDSSSKRYYLQQTQPANPQDGDIWIG